MNNIFISREDGSLGFRQEDNRGQTIQKIPRIISSREACHHLKRSRRHLYRWIERGWIQPVAQFSGDHFFDERSLIRLTSPAKQKRLKALPRHMAPLFPEYDLKNLHLERDADLILSRILERGNKKEIQWVTRHYSTARRRLFLETQGKRLLTPRSEHFWRFLWQVPDHPETAGWRIPGRRPGGLV